MQFDPAARYVCPQCLGGWRDVSADGAQCAQCGRRIAHLHGITWFESSTVPGPQPPLPTARQPFDPAAAAEALWLSVKPGNRVIELCYGHVASWATVLASSGAVVDVIDCDLATLFGRPHQPAGVMSAFTRGWPHLPFAGDAFDHAIWHGYVPSGPPSANDETPSADTTAPASFDAEAHLLDELRRVLRPRGMLWMTATRRPPKRNRQRDRLAQSSGGQAPTEPCRARSLANAEAWIRKAGFTPHESLAELPGHARPRIVLPVDAPDAPPEIVRQVIGNQITPLNRRGLTSWVKSQVAKAAHWTWGRRMAPALVSAERSSDTQLPALADANPGLGARSIMAHLISQSLGEQVVPLVLLVRLMHTVVIPAWSPSRRELVYCKFPFSTQGLASLQKHADMLRWLAAQTEPPIAVPKLIASASTGWWHLIESALPGCGGGRAGGRLATLGNTAADLLLRCHLHTRRAGHRQEMIGLWRERMTAIRRSPLVSDAPALADWLVRLEAALEQVPCTVLAHNDFHLGNIVFERPDRASGVLDWDLADHHGLPLADLIHLAISVLVRSRRGLKSKLLVGLASGQLRQERRWIDRYLEALSLSRELGPWLELYAMTQVWRLTLQATYAQNEASLAAMRAQAIDLVGWRA